MFSKKSSDVVSLVSFYPPKRSFLLADPASVRAVLLDRTRFQEQGREMALAESLEEDLKILEKRSVDLREWRDEVSRRRGDETACSALADLIWRCPRS